MVHIVAFIVGLWWLWGAIVTLLSALGGVVWCALFLRPSQEETELRVRVARLKAELARDDRLADVRRSLLDP